MGRSASGRLMAAQHANHPLRDMESTMLANRSGISEAIAAGSSNGADGGASVLDATKEIVTAFVANNKIEGNALPGLIVEIYTSLSRITDHNSALETSPSPAVPVQDSVQPDYLVCLEDGKRMTMLKRYIKRVYGLSPEQYRKRWGLPGDYPMTAPNHIENLRATAQLGLAERRARRANRASPALMRAG
jgi:predicted transcriptional regulator